MTGKCQDCKYWDKTVWDDHTRRMCLRIKDDDHKVNMVYIEHGGQSWPYLITRADFGCALFEAKEATA